MRISILSTSVELHYELDRILICPSHNIMEIASWFSRLIVFVVAKVTFLGWYMDDNNAFYWLLLKYTLMQISNLDFVIQGGY